METASFVLSAVPIVLYALDNYQRCLRPLKDYWKYEPTLQTIRMNVFIQGEQLDATLRNIGLAKPTRLELKDHLQRLYPKSKCEEFMNIMDRMDILLNKMVENLEVDSSGKPKWTETPPERAIWEWRRVKRSFRHKERQAFIDELQYWNNSLKNVFEKTEIPSDESDYLAENIQARFNPKECDKIRDDVRFVHQALQSVNWTCHCDEHWGSIRLCWHMEKAVLAGRLSLNFSTSQDTIFWRPVSVHVEEKDKQAEALSSIQRPASPQNSPSHSPRRQKIKEIMGVSKKSPNLLPVPDAIVNPTPPGSPPIHREIDCMCQFIRNSTGPKQGVIQVVDDASRRVVVERMDEPQRKLKTVHLETVLEPAARISRPSHLTLSRKQRFSIAAATSWAVLYLCGSPWLDSDWNGKSDLQLFQEDSRTSPSSSLQTDYPILQQLFKPVGQRSSTESTSLVADFQNSQIRNRTLFSLGILLIELCLNKTLDQLRRDIQANDFAASLGVKSPIPSDFEIANRLTESVYQEAGHSYGYAVQRCLRCEFPGRDVTKDFEFQSFRRDFFAGVVAPVQATFEIQPASILNH
ncbi:hypothetical protein F53441_3171 [Fusarium austroafricanum]|uniref:DUF7580 domain-containing protein n=1 Tax=Fusarium austroafricanum TaxID=2364996 RepID=A0A8H4KNB9_9HYPO|nr:hypothetical protein F53441_3171 [Fusarium austroafricanum]